MSSPTSGPVDFYAEVSWTYHDVIEMFKTFHKKQISEEQAEEWLEANEGYLRDRLIELGWEVMSDLVTTDDTEGLPDAGNTD